MKLYEMLLHIENEVGCTISFQPMHELFHSCEQLRIPYHKMLHNHEFCRFVKSLDSNFSCAENKHRSMRIAGYGHRFCGVCPYGIWEHVQPVMVDGELMGVIYFGDFSDVSGLRKDIEGRSYEGPVPPRITLEKKNSLKEWGVFFARFIQCEIEECRKGVTTSEKQHGAKFYCDIVRNLISMRYKEDLRLQDAAAACHVNANYLSNLLKAHTGITFRQMLTEQRIMEAQACLKYHDYMSIAEIAAACGFKDSNYFSLVFSGRCGVSPTDFRKYWKSDPRLAQL